MDHVLCIKSPTETCLLSILSSESLGRDSDWPSLCHESTMVQLTAFCLLIKGELKEERL